MKLPIKKSNMNSPELISPEKLTLYKSKITPYRKKSAASLRGRILDCGGGLGEYLPYFHGKVTSLDIEINALRMLSHAEKVNSNAVELPFNKDSFDAVWACAVVQYVSLKVFVQEAIRVTKPGGKILILVPNGKSPWDRVKRWMGLDSWWDQKGIVTQYNLADLKSYGRVFGEIQFIPFEGLFRRIPQFGHTLMLEIVVGK